MIKIQEEIIPREKEPIFIDYSEIPGSSKKKLLFLKTLLQLINKRDNFIRYEDLELNEGDTETFKLYLKKYQKYFRLEKNKINLIENYNGKIVCEIDLLINDVFTVLSEVDLKNTSNDLLLKNSNEKKTHIQPEKLEEKSIETLEEKPITLFRDPKKNSLNKYLEKFFNTGICQAEINLFFNEVVKNHNEDDVKKIFDFITLCDEIDRIPYRLKMGEITKESAKFKRDYLIKILELIRDILNDKTYWDELIFKIKEKFSFPIDTCDEHVMGINDIDGSYKWVSVNEIANNQNLKIFFAEKGNPEINSKNRAISKFQNKIVFFDFVIPLSSKISPNDLVLGYLDLIEFNYVKVNPLKILTLEEFLKLIKLGVEVCPSEEVIFSFIKGEN
jgi:hypothetical protein